MENLEIVFEKSQARDETERLDQDNHSRFQKESLSNLTRRKFVMVVSGFGAGVLMHGIITPSEAQANLATDLISAFLNLLTIGEKLFHVGETVKIKFGVTNQSFSAVDGHVSIQISYDKDNWMTWLTGKRDAVNELGQYSIDNLEPGGTAFGEHFFKASSKSVHGVLLRTHENYLTANFTVEA